MLAVRPRCQGVATAGRGWHPCHIVATPTSISVPESVRVQYIDPVVRLQQMTHYL